MHGGWKGICIMLAGLILYVASKHMPPEYGVWGQICGAVVALVGCGYVMNYARGRIN